MQNSIEKPFLNRLLNNLNSNFIHRFYDANYRSYQQAWEKADVQEKFILACSFLGLSAYTFSTNYEQHDKVGWLALIHSRYGSVKAGMLSAENTDEQVIKAQALLELLTQAKELLENLAENPALLYPPIAKPKTKEELNCSDMEFLAYMLKQPVYINYMSFESLHTFAIHLTNSGVTNIGKNITEVMIYYYQHCPHVLQQFRFFEFVQAGADMEALVQAILADPAQLSFIDGFCLAFLTTISPAFHQYVFDHKMVFLRLPPAYLEAKVIQPYFQKLATMDDENDFLQWLMQQALLGNLHALKCINNKVLYHLEKQIISNQENINYLPAWFLLEIRHEIVRRKFDVTSAKLEDPLWYTQAEENYRFIEAKQQDFPRHINIQQLLLKKLLLGQQAFLYALNKETLLNLIQHPAVDWSFYLPICTALIAIGEADEAKQYLAAMYKKLKTSAAENQIVRIEENNKRIKKQQARKILAFKNQLECGYRYHTDNAYHASLLLFFFGEEALRETSNAMLADIQEKRRKVQAKEKQLLDEESHLGQGLKKLFMQENMQQERFFENDESMAETLTALFTEKEHQPFIFEEVNEKIIINQKCDAVESSQPVIVDDPKAAAASHETLLQQLLLMALEAGLTMVTAANFLLMAMVHVFSRTQPIQKQTVEVLPEIDMCVPPTAQVLA